MRPLGALVQGTPGRVGLASLTLALTLGAPTLAAAGPAASADDAPAAAGPAEASPATPAPADDAGFVGDPEPVTAGEVEFAIPDGPPRDPNDAPFMPTPNGQPPSRQNPVTPAVTPRHSSTRRFQLTLAPIYASLAGPFVGRDGVSLAHGAGFNVEAELQLYQFLLLRAHVSHTLHPLTEARVLNNDEEVVVTASGGLLQATTFGLSAVLAVDIGMFRPLVDLGVGAMRVSYPEGVAKGQQGQQCEEGETCDFGLSCGGGACVPALVPDAHFGLAVDALLFEHLSVGAQFRYHARLLDPLNFPIYLVLGARVGVRW
ncbi:MAG: hypothetical protein R3A51_18395 [Nannocystaceae bacterium]